MARKKPTIDDWVGTAGSLTVEIVLWIPSADRDGKDLASEQVVWKDKALRMFSETFGKGATAMPRAEGAWLNPQSKQLIVEYPIMIVCYVTLDQVADSAAISAVGKFAFEMGKAMYQGEVALRVGQRFFFINTF